MACSWLAETILPMEASGPGVWPRESAVIERKRVSFSPSAWTYQSASFSRNAASSSAELFPDGVERASDSSSG